MNSLYFSTVKGKNFKHIHMQKIIKVGQFIESVHYKKVDGPWGVKGHSKVWIGSYDFNFWHDSLKFFSYWDRKTTLAFWKLNFYFNWCPGAKICSPKLKMLKAGHKRTIKSS